MHYNFDIPINRKNTRSFKWDKNLEYFGKEDVIPLWVADMDFQCAQPIVEAMMQRAAHPIYGYTVRMDSTIKAFQIWMQNRHGYSVDKKWLTFSPPGIIYALQQLLLLVSEPGDSIILQTPNYGPLSDIVTGTGRKLVLNQMKFSDGVYSLDFEQFEEQARQGAKALIISSPNNPTGRVWTRQELLKLCNICIENDLWILSDEIYADFIFHDFIHTPVTSLSPEIAERSVSCLSSNKGFNLGGLQMATLIIPNENLRRRYDVAMEIAQTRLDNVFGTIAMEAAYSSGEDWLDHVIPYVADNVAFVKRYLEQHLPQIQPVTPEGTFLMWLDCRQMRLNPLELEHFLIQEAGIAATQGSDFGESGNGFIRINVACPKALLEKALTCIDTAWKARND